MICDLCRKNNAVMHIEEFSNNGVRKINLCLECAAAKGFSIGNKEIDNIVLNFLENVFSQEKNDGDIIIRDDIKCIHCQTTVKEITENQQVGCVKCYDVFEDLIDQILFQNNNSLQYKGRLPVLMDLEREQKGKLEDLKRRLKDSILTEDFKKAATLRDEIKLLKESYKTKKRNYGSKRK